MNLLKLLCLFSLMGIGPAAQASDYPPEYVQSRECQSKGPFEVCIVNRKLGNFPRIEVHYQGVLAQSSESKINLWMLNLTGRGNGQDTYYKLAAQNPFEKPRVVFNDVRGHKCKARPPGTLPDTLMPVLNEEYQWCQRRVQESTQSELYVWEVNEVPTAERSFVRSILSDSSLTIQLAAFDQNGTWDSNSGQNYEFSF